MNLSEFLASASSNDATARDEAKAYTETVYDQVSSEAVTVILLQSSLYAALNDIAEDTTSSARGIAMAFMDRVRTPSVFNWSPDTAKGQSNRNMIDNLIGLLPNLQSNLEAFKAAAEAEASQTVTPFANTTLHDVKLTRGTVQMKSVTQSGGYAVITITADTEKHNPRLLAGNPRTGERVRIESFRGVSKAGTYDAKVPSEWRNADLYVDDAYGVI